MRAYVRADVQTGAAATVMRETALLHIKFAPRATRGSFSFLFIRCFDAHESTANAETIRRREIRNNRAQCASTRAPGAWPPAAVTAAAATTVAVFLEIRDARFARQAKHCWPEADGEGS